MEGKFEVLEEVNWPYERFRAQGTLLKLRLLPPPEVIPDDDSKAIPDDDSEVILDNDNEVTRDDDNEFSPDPITHFESCVGALFEYELKNIEDSDMVGLVIQNQNNDKPIGFSFRRKDQLSVEVIWKLFDKVVV
jgi:hypothetical protein